MDVYVYKAALWCGPCMRQKLLDDALVEADFDHSDRDPANALTSAVWIRGYKEESDYDSDELPKGPYAAGGREADTPQHCDACGAFLENPLTAEGCRYVSEALIAHARDGDGAAKVLVEWAKLYNACYYEPGEATLADLQFEYSMEDDDWGTAMGWWFTIAGELHTRGARIPDEWQYRPGIQPADPDDRNAVIVASATTETLMRFMEDVEDDVKRLKREGRDY
jgi:hypothetical protein